MDEALSSSFSSLPVLLSHLSLSDYLLLFPSSCSQSSQFLYPSVSLDVTDMAGQVGAWRVGLVGDLLYEGPIVDRHNRIINWHVAWRPDRKFPIDMAGFAFAVREVVSRPELEFDPTAPRGHIESYFLTNLVEKKEDLEAMGMDLDYVMVWHTRTQIPGLKWEAKVPSNPAIQV